MTFKDADELCQACAFAVLAALSGLVIGIVIEELLALWNRPG